MPYIEQGPPVATAETIAGEENQFKMKIRVGLG